MRSFIVNRNAQSNGDHEVHELNAGCSYLPDKENQVSLGWHSGCHSAVTAAKEKYSQSNGCFYCASPCHTT